MFPPKGPNHYGQQPPYGGQQSYGQLVRLCANYVYVRFDLYYACLRSALFFTCDLSIWTLFFFCSLGTVDFQPRLQRVALMVVVLVPALDRGQLCSMEGRMLRFMVRSRWLAVTDSFVHSFLCCLCTPFIEQICVTLFPDCGKCISCLFYEMLIVHVTHISGNLESVNGSCIGLVQYIWM
jgi:hypothetical protein